MRLHAVTIATVLVICVGSALPQIPPLMNYQGVLTDAGGAAVPDGLYEITFRLYPDESAESAIWEESKPVLVTKGIFNVILGETVPLEMPFESMLWLGISVEGEAELEPRIPLVASPYSFNARSVQDSAITTMKIANGAVTDEKIAEGAVTGGNIAGGQVVRNLNGLTDDVALVPGTNIEITPVGQEIVISATGGGSGVTGSGAAGQVAVWNGTSSIDGDNMLYWDDTNKRLGIGTTGPNARLRVESAAEDYTAVFASNATAGNPQVVRANYLGTSHIDARGVYGRSNPDGGFGVGGEFEGGWKGVIATANGAAHDYYIYGVHAVATGTQDCADWMNRYGVYGEASGPGGIATCFYGVYGEASAANDDRNYGAYGRSYGSAGQRYGVYGVAGGIGTGWRVGVLGWLDSANPDSAYAIYSIGDLAYTGDLVGPPSDAALKEDIEPLRGALATVMRLDPVSFRYTGDQRYEHMNLSDGRHFGLIAQQLEEVVPELVQQVSQPPIYEHPEGGGGTKGSQAAPELLLEAMSYKGIRYIELIPILVQAIKEQQATITAQQRTIDENERAIGELRAEVEALNKR